MGRPSSFSPDVAEEICTRMAEGKGLRQICALNDMPERRTVLRWLESSSDFRHQYARAREALMDWYSEEILKIAFDDAGDVFIDGEKVVNDHARVQRARLKVDTLKWIMSKLAPRRYGDNPVEEAPPVQQVTRIERVFVDGRAPSVDENDPDEQPRQITFRQPEPGELTAEQWSTLRQLLDLIQRTVGEQPSPDEVFAIIREALLARFGAG